jgi:predicted TIM-barrel fold metal-dependent hydrolase
MRDGFPIFDTHTHIGRAVHSGRVYTAAQLLEAMDLHGVDRSMVIPFPLVEDQRAAHDEIGHAVLQNPDRLMGAVCLDPYLPRDRFREEVKRCVECYGFRAMKLQPQFQPLNVLAPVSDLFFETAEEFRLPVICHTGAGVPFALPSHFMMPARRFPAVTIVLAHCGGPLFAGEAMVAASFCPNIVLELSSLLPHHILEILREVSPDRLMIGSDLPENLPIEIGKILGLSQPGAVRRQILSTTGERVFAAPKPAASHHAPPPSRYDGGP